MGERVITVPGRGRGTEGGGMASDEDHPAGSSRFALVRRLDDLDPGDVVADGVEFADGTVVLRWRDHPSTGLWPDMGSMLAVYTWAGQMGPEWIDPPVAAPTPQIRAVTGG